jgi:4-deoxy-L-threo-5-hexosulose-uronate ketol-isomerase
MEFRFSAHPEDAKKYTTSRLRQEYHVANVFEPDALRMVYSYDDRMILGGACPRKELRLGEEKEVGAEYFLERRELGAINIGGRGSVEVDGQEYTLETLDGLYIGMGAKEVKFRSEDPEKCAKFYFNSTTAHERHPTVKIALKELEPGQFGSPEQSNKRRIYKFITPGLVESSQLTMGMTILEECNVWNTMPCHLHDRRMEVYFYFNLPADALVFHFMGEPSETRHIVVRNEEAVLSPSWSIHSGAGTSNYIFIWGMGGENKIVTDVEAQTMDCLR